MTGTLGFAWRACARRVGDERARRHRVGLEELRLHLDDVGRSRRRPPGSHIAGRPLRGFRRPIAPQAAPCTAIRLGCGVITGGSRSLARAPRKRASPGSARAARPAGSRATPRGRTATTRTLGGDPPSASCAANRRSLDHESATGAPIGSPSVIDRVPPNRPAVTAGSIRASVPRVVAVPIQIWVDGAETARPVGVRPCGRDREADEQEQAHRQDDVPPPNEGHLVPFAAWPPGTSGHRAHRGRRPLGVTPAGPEGSRSKEHRL